MRHYRDPLASLFDTEAQRDESGGESIWNLLVQILLPLVLILTFAIVTQIMRYKQAYYDYASAVQNQGNPVDRVALQEALIDAQLQRLLLALEKVKREEEQQLFVALFPDVQRITREGVRIEDASFKALCTNTRRTFRSPQSHADGLYSRVLDKAELQDPGRTTVRRTSYDAIPDEAERMVAVMRATPGVVFRDNRDRIHNEILDFQQGLKYHIVGLQEDLIRLLFEELMRNPEDMDEATAQRAQSLVDPTLADDERERIANEIYRTITQRWRNRLDDEGYVFLDESWSKLLALN